jgi:hypothetical protein
VRTQLTTLTRRGLVHSPSSVPQTRPGRSQRLWQISPLP